MNFTDYVRRRLASRDPQVDEGVVEELAQHAESAYAAARAEGRDAAAARTEITALIDTWVRDPAVRPRRAARRTVEPPAAGAVGLAGLYQDARYGLRLLVRQPGSAAMSILTTALGIAAATTLFSLTYGVLVRPYPWPGADRLVGISEKREGATRNFPSITTNATYLAWKDQPATLESLAAFSDDQMTLASDAGSDRLTIVAATASLFDVLGVRPALGSTFTTDEEGAGRDHVIVLSHDLWARRFSGREDVVGTSISLDGEKFTVVGVMPKGFFFPTPAASAWRPMQVPPVIGDDPAARSISLFDAIGRLRAGVTPEQAAAEGTARSRNAPDLGMVGIAVFGTKNPATISAVPYLRAVTASVRPALIALLVAVGLLLATAIANVAGMQLVRAAGRRREVALRAALGAGTARLARQLLTENAIIGVAGGGAGLLLSVWMHTLLPHLLPAGFPRIDDVVVDWRVVGFAVVAAVAASVAFGLLPSLTARRIGLVEVLNDDNLAPVGSGLRSRVGRARSAIMAGQVAVAVALLAGASLLTRSFDALVGVDRGYDPHNLLTAEILLPDYRFTSVRRAAFVDDVLERVRRLPGVTDAAVSSLVPLMHREQLMGFSMDGPNGRRDAQAAIRDVSPDYFASLGMHLVEGRDFGDADTVGTQSVVVVNQAFVRTYLTGPALDTILPLGRDEHHPGARIVGVVDDVRQGSATDPPQPEIFRTYRQSADGLRASTPLLLARTTGNPADLVPAVRSIVGQVDPTVLFTSVLTMEDRLSESLARPRLYAVLLGSFAALALLVSGIGVFGVLSYNVAQRVREIGVRAALGARPVDIVGLVLRQGLGATLAGVGAGLVLAVVAAASLRSLVFGIAPYDPVSFILAPAALIAIAALACVAPARRAARVDPLKALRQG